MQLRECARRAVSRLGVSEIAFGDAPDNAFDGVPLLRLVQQVERWMDQWHPECILTHAPSDCNIDHRRTCEAVLAATRPQPGCGVLSVLAFEVPSATEWGFGTAGPHFAPTIFEALAPPQLEAKLAALAEYRDEMRPFPHPRSPEAIRALSAWRGATVGVEAAEAFMLLREVRR